LPQDGEELVQFMLKVLRGQLPGARLRDRMAAAEWLADRGFGRPVQAVGMAMDALDDRPTLELIRALTAPRPASDRIYDEWPERQGSRTPGVDVDRWPDMVNVEAVIFATLEDAA
jgi:hypothetical protein